WIKNNHPQIWEKHKAALHFDEAEITNWAAIFNNIYLPNNDSLGIYLQQDGYMDKEQILVKDLPATDRPLNQKWSWDRILRSCFIKQADVLQGLYFFEEDFDIETHERNFHFYEQRTVHESSLSPCVHSILAAKIGDKDKSYEMYLRTSRLDLDDYNNDTEDGLHITSMAGTWLSVVKGFGGMRIVGDCLSFKPFLPKHFTAIAFKVKFREAVILCKITQTGISITNYAKNAIKLLVFDQERVIEAQGTEAIAYAS
ncbi:MAG TPA: glycosyl hydrolase family 65 protein, partial [Saprospiraceae bacterium]|nr:glycosyl hydrolase family 65 protein [Saprospiraceae bacterium]